MFSAQSSYPPIHQLVEHQTAQTPDAIAVTFQDQRLTYQQLNQKANQVAHYLQTLGVQPETLVGVCIERSLEMVVALLGILKAGGAYVPLDPSYPKERLGFIIEDTLLPVLLTQQPLQKNLPLHQAQEICIDRDCEAINRQAIENPGCNVHAENLAYIIYTSGSTGRPKGVAIEHRNTVAFINWAKEFFTPEQLQGVLASTSICFDLSVFEIFVTLSHGGKVILAKDALELPSLIAADEVTLINTVPSAVEALFYTNGIPKSVRTINLAGEPLQNALVQKLYELDHIEQVFNLYGPSEDTTYSTVALIPKGNHDIPSIGQPITNTQIHLLDFQLKPVPDGAEGEIYIGGAGLARGYLNRPDLTAEKFIPDPFNAEPDSRLYKTGDLAIRLPNGNLKFLGRIDHQVKIRGFRIELGEIESVLNLHSTVRQAVLLVREATPTDQRLVAYVVPKSNTESVHQNLLIRELRSFLAQKLPEFMVPSAFVLLEELPLTLNGKLDRRALPIPKWTPIEESLYVEPRTLIEIQVAKIWGRLLGVEKVGVHDNFYELGGYSLLAIRLVMQMTESFQQEIVLESLLENPTVAGLSQVIEALEQSTPDRESSRKQADDFVLDPSIFPDNIIVGAIPEIFLTGATGFLGAFLLQELLQQTRSDIYCLVRASSLAEGQARIQTSLKRYSLWDENFSNRIKLVLGDLDQPFLGIEASRFERLAEKIDIIYHCGAWVNIVYPYSILKTANVIGTQEVIRLASKTKIKPIHFVSTVDVFASSEHEFLRTIYSNTCPGPISKLYSGYAQSKYTAEQIILTANTRGVPCSIYRPSNIVGDIKNGIFPANSFVSMMMKGCLQMGFAPNLDARLNLVPANYVSQAIVYLSRVQNLSNQAHQIINPNPISWDQFVNWLIKSGCSIQEISYEAWYTKLLKIGANSTDNELIPLINLFSNKQFIQKSLGSFYFNVESIHQDFIKAGIVCPPVDEIFLNASLESFIQSGYLNHSNVESKIKNSALQEIYS
jgi:amino acid adenylation domain-containing protein/thioester reductase-like protein